MFEHLESKPIGVRHADLQRYTPNSDYKSVCVHDDCDGLLLVARNPDNELLEEDRCTLCAQRYVYLDIVEMQRTLG